jgi:hypothetical protein
MFFRRTQMIMRSNSNFYLLAVVFISALLTTFTADAQISYADSVVLGGGDSLQAYYTLASGHTDYVALDEWDLAFETQGITFGIWLNEAKGERLYVYPNGDTSNWNTVDTVGLSGWEVLHNSDTTWATGGFDRNSTDPFDVGWGFYTGPPNHAVYGDSINIVVFADGSVKKLWIMSLDDKLYKFRYADLDGSNEVLDSIDKNNYPEDNFAYYNLNTGQELNREPANTQWDLLFTKSLHAMEVAPMVYEAAWGAVYLNHQVQVARATGVNVNDFDPMSYNIEDSTITAIGTSYRELNSSVWQAVPSTAYYVRGKNGTVYKLVFTEVDSATGKIVFNVTYDEPATGIAGISNGLNLSVYPNPIEGQLNLTFNTTTAGNMQLNVTDIAGKLLVQKNIEAAAGANTYQLSTAQLPQGLLLVNLVSAEGSFTQKVIKCN